LHKLCESLGLVYTRFVDDITISGPFDLSRGRSGVLPLLERTLVETGFRANAKKTHTGRMRDLAVTQIRLKDGHFDVTKEFMEKIERQLDDAAGLARGERPRGLCYTEAQVMGRVRFACWVNPGRMRPLLRRARSIRWAHAAENAQKMGLVVVKKRLIPLPPAEPKQTTGHTCSAPAGPAGPARIRLETTCPTGTSAVQ
jgi:hypothetical protein